MPGQGPAAGRCTIRKALAADVEAITHIWHDGWRDGHLGHVPPGLVPHRHEAQFRTRALSQIDATWVAESEGGIVGFVAIKGDELEHLYVDRASRGTGVADMLIRTGAQAILAAGHHCAWLAVVAGNQRARAFYTRLGWRDAGPFVHMVVTEDGPFPVPSHRYEIELSADAAAS
jgi:ribosomal protein S18 acetylase RimI-like enzyme